VHYGHRNRRILHRRRRYLWPACV